MIAPLFEDRPLGAGEWARFHAAGGNVELFEAAFDRFAYERHFHDAYAIGVTLSGVQRFWCQGVTHDSVAGRTSQRDFPGRRTAPGRSLRAAACE